MTDRTVAFIGLGNMGGPMAANLAAAGVRVRGVDVVPEARERAAAHGIEIVEEIADAVAGADVVITSLPNGQIVKEAYAAIIPAAAPGTLLIDTSTIAVDDAVEIAQQAEAAGLRAVDAPVSGGVVGAEAGTLTFMLGGDDLDGVAEVLEPMAGRTVVCGGHGTGQTAKMCNNLILAISMVGVSEAYVIAERLGLSHQALYDVVSTSAGQCWALNVNCPVPGPVPTSPANRDFQPGFATALMAKDLGIAKAAMEQTGTQTVLGETVADLYRRLTDDGRGGLDFSAVIEEIRGTGEDATR